jgi:hypothetical protein
MTNSTTTTTFGTARLRGALIGPAIGVCLLLGVTTAAVAQDSGTPTASDQGARSEAATRFEEGVSLAGQARWERALQEFEASLAAWPTPPAAFNRCICLRRLERLAEAAACYERFLRDHGEDASAEDRAEANDELRRLGTRLGTVTLEVQRPETAEVVIDGVAVGSAPLPGRLFLAPGRHSLEVRAPGHVPSRRELDLPAGAELTLVMSLEPQREGIGTILIEADIPQVVVSLDGQEIGTTPLLDQALVAAAGEHVVEGRRPGYEPARVVVQVAAGQARRARLELTQSTDIAAEHAGVLEVAVSEDESEVLLDGRSLEAGPVPAGQHRLEVRHEGFEPWTGDVDVAAGEPTRIEVSLRPTPAFLESYRTRARGFRSGAWATTGTAVALLGTAAVLLGWNAGRRDDWEAENAALEGYTGMDRLRRLEANQELGDSIDTVNGVSWALLAAGGAAAAVGVVLFVVGPRPDRYDSFTISFRADGLAARVEW